MLFNYYQSINIILFVSGVKYLWSQQLSVQSSGHDQMVTKLPQAAPSCRMGTLTD